MAVLHICCAFRLWVAAFISDNTQLGQLVRKRSRNAVHISVRFLCFFGPQFTQWESSWQRFKNGAYIQARLAFIYRFQGKKAIWRQRFKNEVYGSLT